MKHTTLLLTTMLSALLLASCEKKSLDEQLYKEVMSIKKASSQKKIEKLVQKGADVNYNNMIVDIVKWNDISDDI